MLLLVVRSGQVLDFGSHLRSLAGVPDQVPNAHLDRVPGRPEPVPHARAIAGLSAPPTPYEPGERPWRAIHLARSLRLAAAQIAVAPTDK